MILIECPRPNLYPKILGHGLCDRYILIKKFSKIIQYIGQIWVFGFINEIGHFCGDI